MIATLLTFVVAVAVVATLPDTAARPSMSSATLNVNAGLASP